MSVFSWKIFWQATVRKSQVLHANKINSDCIQFRMLVEKGPKMNVFCNTSAFPTMKSENVCCGEKAISCKLFDKFVLYSEICFVF